MATEEFKNNWIEKLTKLGFVDVNLFDDSRFEFGGIDLSNENLWKWLFVGMSDNISSLFGNTEYFNATMYFVEGEGMQIDTDIVSNMIGSQVENKLVENLNDAVKKLTGTIVLESVKVENNVKESNKIDYNQFFIDFIDFLQELGYEVTDLGDGTFEILSEIPSIGDELMNPNTVIINEFIENYGLDSDEFTIRKNIIIVSDLYYNY